MNPHSFACDCCTLQAWKQTLWSDVKTEEMEEGAKNFVKEVKALPKGVRPPCNLAPA